jgi:hypothetical protein
MSKGPLSVFNLDTELLGVTRIPFVCIELHNFDLKDADCLTSSTM